MTKTGNASASKKAVSARTSASKNIGASRNASARTSASKNIGASKSSARTEDLSPGERRNRFARRVAIVLVFALVGTMIIPALAHLF